MSTKFYLSSIIFIAVLALASFFLILNFFSPDGADTFLLILLFFSLFIGLAGLFCLILFFSRHRKINLGQEFYALGVSFRQGTLLSLLLAGSLFLRTFEVLWWWSGLILLVLVLATEFFSLKRQV